MDVSLKVADFIRRSGMLSAPEKLVVGVSGGPDSLCALDVLRRLEYPVVAAHLDHQLRPESGREAEQVRKIAKQYDVPIFVEQADVRAGSGKGRSLEEAARLARYNFLVRVANRSRSRYVVTGHTADDQAETVLMHLLRGAGPSGLRGMLPCTPLEGWVGLKAAQGIQLVRPLLETTRAETEAHCKANGLQPIIDPSNVDQTFFRNRLRHELLPLLETYNPGIRDVLRRTGRIMAGVSELLEELVADVWPQVVRTAGEGALALQVGALRGLPIAVQRCLVRQAIQALRPGIRDVGYDAIARALEGVQDAQQGTKQCIVGGVEMHHLGEEVVLRLPGARVQFPGLPQLALDEGARLKIPGTLSLANGWRLQARVERISSEDRERLLANQDAALAALDAGKLPDSLEVRPHKIGERIRVLGMPGSTKISSLLVNLHIPQPARARWPMVVAEGKVVWVVGLRMAHDARLTESSREVVVLRAVAPEGDR